MGMLYNDSLRRAERARLIRDAKAKQEEKELEEMNIHRQQVRVPTPEIDCIFDKIYNPQFRKLSLGERPDGVRSDGEETRKLQEDENNKTPGPSRLLHAYSTDMSPDTLQIYNSRL